MKKIIFSTVCLSILLTLFSCISKKAPNYFPVTNLGTKKNENNISNDYVNIIDTKNGLARLMPIWLRTFLDGGIEDVEKLDAYSDKYVFIDVNEGENIILLNKWIDYYAIMQDFPLLVADRIEKRMYLSTSLYPGDEYGLFFEAMMNNAYNAVYDSAVKEDTYWIKIKSQNVEGVGGVPSPPPSETYKFFILITIEKNAMQTIIRNMMAKSSEEVKLTAIHKNSVNRLRNIFFERF